MDHVGRQLDEPPRAEIMRQRDHQRLSPKGRDFLPAGDLSDHDRHDQERQQGSHAAVRQAKRRVMHVRLDSVHFHHNGPKSSLTIARTAQHCR